LSFDLRQQVVQFTYKNRLEAIDYYFSFVIFKGQANSSDFK
jgi:hypothetical protein